MMVQELSISEARRRLPALLKTIKKDAGRTFIIHVHNEPVAALSAVAHVPKQGTAVKALLNLAKHQEKEHKPQSSPASHHDVSSETFKEFLYGKSR